VTFGETIDAVAEAAGNRSLSLTLLSWKQSLEVVNGPYVSGYYTFTAKSGMKFVVLTYVFKNNWTREQSTPYLDSGEVQTDKGYYYRRWSPPAGVLSTEYGPRPSSAQELQEFVGDSGGFETLLPEEEIRGQIVFEIPEGAVPVEATISQVPVRFR
jgi:hypothetical protein